jgi:hypothetical protein
MRGYSYTFVLKVRGLAKSPKAPKGVKLGVKAIDRGIPISFIAKKLRVSRMAVYDWFTGQYAMSEQRAAQLEALLDATNP